MCHLVLSSFIYLTFEVNSSYSLFCSETLVQLAHFPSNWCLLCICICSGYERCLNRLYNLSSCWFRFAKQKQDVPLSYSHYSFASFCWALVGYSKHL
ncbi:hypothetical protein BD560DRAFT_383700 [Blakeslea trispora]|nr:hypothetical protein BD560DRAFT_418561 [Blakeslea trispora]KAI8327218.1 hypothetical protein BD560DRAFT_418427 [Blakeslea trispora]KAI8371148.1 hypothetical protein BD560DRAFT_396265 [Blakeslea trispora]KAI8385584.1 hypothetical protein BD560DRAFT_383627 [Blakeslea trispora]KAI8385587.1 hypothetical protein BD560DRAFT_383700 [Blakeslea trispora]